MKGILTYKYINFLGVIWGGEFMKFTYLGFNQKKALEMGLDSIDLGILRYFVNFMMTGAMIKREIDGEFLYWMQYEKCLENVPILGIKSKCALKRRLNKLVDAEVLVFKLIKIGGTYTFYGIGKRYEELIFHNKQMQKESLEIYRDSYGKKQSAEKQRGVGSYEEPPSAEKLNQNINLLKNNNIYTSVIEYLNKKTGKSFKSDTTKNRELIRARIREGFHEEDFKRVIDNKVKAWLGKEQEKYLRPETLFGNKFEGYLNEGLGKDFSKEENSWEGCNSDFSY